ncbi:MAG TPA: hypothetical protein VN848_12765 [Gemmatimonadales bacterium]|nr:hypothetical protein [Gemmatimonadales bacterium]
MAKDKASVSLAELRHPGIEIRGGFTKESLFPTIEGAAHIVPDNPVNGEGGAQDPNEAA